MLTSVSTTCCGLKEESTSLMSVNLLSRHIRMAWSSWWGTAEMCPTSSQSAVCEMWWAVMSYSTTWRVWTLVLTIMRNFLSRWDVCVCVCVIIQHNAYMYNVVYFSTDQTNVVCACMCAHCRQVYIYNMYVLLQSVTWQALKVVNLFKGD